MGAMRDVRAASLLIAMSWAAASPAGAAECTETLGFYQKSGYTVRAILVRAPLDFFKIAERAAQPDGLSLKARRVEPSGTVIEAGLFDAVAFSLSGQEIRDRLDSARPGQRAAFTLVLPAIRNCDTESKTVEAQYTVYAFGVPAVAGQRSGLPLPETPGAAGQEGTRTIAASGVLRLFSTLFPQGFLGYNASRRLFGGTRTSILAAPGGVFDKLQLEASGSTSSSVLRSAFLGARDYASGPVQHAEWELGYERSDLPASPIQLEQAKMFGRFSAATAPLGRGDVVLGFGTSIEGGRQSASGGGISTLPSELQHGAIKSYLGAAAHFGRNKLKATYGLQLGKAQPDRWLDYTTHIVEASHEVRFARLDRSPAGAAAGGRHYPVTLETGFMGGRIWTRGVLPLNQRFFGGNAFYPFIPGDSWRIRSQPLIRSFPQNRFNLAAQGNLGATSALAANFTVAKTVWARPLVPSEMLADPDFKPALDGALNGAQRALENRYIGESAPFKTIIHNLLLLEPVIEAVRKSAATIREDPKVGTGAVDAAEAVLLDLEDMDTGFAALRTPESGPVFEQTQTLVEGFPDRGVDPLVTTFADDIGSLAEAIAKISPAEAAALRDRADALRKAQAASLTLFQALDSKGAQERADQDMKYPRLVLNQFLNELNLWHIAPVGFFDVARLGPKPAAGGAVRYGIGGGVRFGLLNVEFTVGYSFNLDRRGTEGRGALIVALDIRDIFR